MLWQAASALISVAVVAVVARADQDEALLQPGSYEVEVRLELPNVVNWAGKKTTTICVANAEGTSDSPFPVLSDNNPLATCPARNVQRNGAMLSFDIACPGRDGARARAVYTLMPRGFEGRIAMVMGSKNMTMTETQVGRRIGACGPVGAVQR
jgi:hypothetical protein